MTPKELLEMRKTLNLTQQQLAVKLGVAEVTVSRWERGQHRPSKLALKQLKRLVNRRGRP